MARRRTRRSRPATRGQAVLATVLLVILFGCVANQADLPDGATGLLAVVIAILCTVGTAHRASRRRSRRRH